MSTNRPGSGSQPPSESAAIASSRTASKPGAAIRVVDYRLSSATKRALMVGSVETLDKAK